MAKRTKRMWGGFESDKLGRETERYSHFKLAAVFFSEAAARRVYQDVRPLRVMQDKIKLKARRPTTDTKR